MFIMRTITSGVEVTGFTYAAVTSSHYDRCPGRAVPRLGLGLGVLLGCGEDGVRIAGGSYGVIYTRDWRWVHRDAVVFAQRRAATAADDDHQDGRERWTHLLRRR